MLVGHPFEGDRPAAGRAGSRQRYADHPVDPIRHRPARLPAIGIPRLATRPPGAGVGPILGERGGLPPACPPELLHLPGQLTDPGPELLVAHLQPFDLASELVTLGAHPLVFGFQHRDPLAQHRHDPALRVASPAPRPCHRGANHTTPALRSRTRYPNTIILPPDGTLSVNDVLACPRISEMTLISTFAAPQG